MKGFRVAGLTIASDPMTRENDDETLWSYDEATGLLLSKTYPDLHQELYGYDTMNRLTSKTQARQVDDRETPLTTSYVYDDRSRRLHQVCHNDKTGLVYYNYRYYNTQDGRWINRDSIAEQGGVNLYAYVGNAVSWIVDIFGQAPSLENILKEFGNFEWGADGMSKECWCKKFGKFLDMLANDPSITSLDDFIDTLGSGRSDSDLVRQVAEGLATAMNEQIGVASKLFNETEDPMRKLTRENISAVGLKDQFLANGADNARHFSYTLAHGWWGNLALKISDKTGHVFTSNSSERGQETKAEIKGDNAALSGYKELKQSIPDRSSKDQWTKNKHKIEEIWLSRFCR